MNTVHVHNAHPGNEHGLSLSCESWSQIVDINIKKVKIH